MWDDEYNPDIEMSEQNKEKDLEGNIKTYSIQAENRIKIPDSWLKDLGWEQKDDIMLVHEGDGIRLIESSIENVREMG